MSREIKFRAWTGKTMMYQEKQYLGSFIRRVVMQVTIDHDFPETYEHESYLPKGSKINDYLQQFADFKDKKEREVYDGDYLANEWGKYRVYWDRGGFVVQSEDGMRYDLSNIDVKTLEVIGNRSENPELLSFFPNGSKEANITGVGELP